MEATIFWKTFNLCKELSLSGSYIYNGLKAFDDMESLQFEEEIFEFLYSISVGIERLQKISIILKENIIPSKQNDFEKSLITHNHMELMKRIRENESSRLSSVCNKFLNLLCIFYKSWRYDRFSISDYNNYDKEKRALIEFIEKYLNLKITNDFINITKNTVQIKQFVGRTIGKIVDYLYQIIVRESNRLNIYTYEVRANSKACKIFLKKEYDFLKEDIFWKELLVYILNNVEHNEILSFYKSCKPLDFDEGLLVQLIGSFKNDLLKQEHIEMLDLLYEEVENKNSRFEFLELIGNENFYLDSEDKEDCDEEPL